MSEKWMNHYKDLCDRAKHRASTKEQAIQMLGYTERHHIIPRCLGGNDDIENLIYLSAREHYIAHQMLVKIYPFNKKLVYALSMMLPSTKYTKRNNRLYDWIRRQLSETVSADVERSKKISKSLTGLTKENCEGKRRCAEKLTGRNKNNDERYAKISKKVSETLIGRTKEEYEYIRNASIKRGLKIKGRTKDTNEGIKRQSEKISGANNYLDFG